MDYIMLSEKDISFSTHGDLHSKSITYHILSSEIAYNLSESGNIFVTLRWRFSGYFSGTEILSSEQVFDTNFKIVKFRDYDIDQIVLDNIVSNSYLKMRDCFIVEFKPGFIMPEPKISETSIRIMQLLVDLGCY